ncbi:hypothetical protein [Nocardia sp. NPDC127526]|uniref:hypothetical protein n=1 Tax=Nocardia sp. NPDC127526 TaxID=3345393 RepID=UPI0036252EE8
MQTDNTTAPLPRSNRVAQLFATFHIASAPEQSAGDVARAVSALTQRIVSADDIAALRAPENDRSPADAELLAALAQHFQVPAVYLTGDDAAAADIHRELRLLAAARDAGVRHLALRGDDIDIDVLTQQLTQLAENPPPPPDQAN